MDVSEIIIAFLPFILMGFIGGVAYVLANSSTWNDLKSFASFKRYLLGAIIGGIYNCMYSTWDFPDGIMAFVSGYAGTDFINKLIDRATKKNSVVEDGK